MKSEVLDRLTAQWVQAKAREAEANAERLQIEQLICAELPAVGAESVQRVDLGEYVLKVTHKVTRTVDSDALQRLWPNLEANVQKAFAWKASVRVAELRKVQEFLPAAYAQLSHVIEAKPAKPSVEIVAHEKQAA